LFCGRGTQTGGKEINQPCNAKKKKPTNSKKGEMFEKFGRSNKTNLGRGTAQGGRGGGDRKT